MLVSNLLIYYSGNQSFARVAQPADVGTGTHGPASAGWASADTSSRFPWMGRVRVPVFGTTGSTVGYPWAVLLYTYQYFYLIFFTIYLSCQQPATLKINFQSA